MSTLVVYADAADGTIQSGGDFDSYASARAGTGGVLQANTAATDHEVGQYYANSGDPDFIDTNSVFESFESFDTSSVGSGSTVSSAVLRLTSSADYSVTDFTLQARLHDWGASLTTADFVAGASLSGLTLLAHYATSGGFTANTAYDLADDAFAANVSKTASTRILLCSSRTVSGTAPSGQESVLYRSADYTGTTNDPRLTVTYTAGADTPSAGQRLYKRLAMIWAG